MNKLKIPLILILISVFSASNAAEPTSSQSSETTVVFLRSSFVGSAIGTSIYEVTNGETRFIGILKNKKRINYKTVAGKHTFMVVSEAADFMEADVISGKTYYSIITPRPGAWKARFSIFPVRNDGTTKFNTETKNFEKWMKKTKVVAMTTKSEDWYAKHKESVEKKRAKYWESWQNKSAADLALRTLNPGDGV